MELPRPETAETVVAPEGGPVVTGQVEPARWDARRGVLRIVGSLVLFFVAMALLARFLGPQLEGAGRAFIGRFGLVGIAFGMVLADALSMPPPPPFYIMIVATGSSSQLVGMTVICAASILGGNIGYRLSALLSKRPFFRKRIDATRVRMDRMFERYGVWAFVIASFTPMPFSVMCYVAGVYRIKPWLFAFVCFSRIPRLLVIYWLVVAGWMTGSA